jgi:hypothetical protein
VAEAVGGKATGDLGTLVDYSLVEALPAETQDKLGDAALAWWIANTQAHPGYEGMDALETEAEGLMGAMAWAHNHQRSKLLLRLAHAMRLAWNTWGRRSEDLRAYEYCTAAAYQLGDLKEQWWTARHLAVVLYQTGQFERARAGYEEALRLARELEDKSAIQVELYGLAVFDGETGNIVGKRSGLEEALQLAQVLGDKLAIRHALHELALLDDNAGNNAAAEAG